jgi:hypothetical protein
MSELEYIFRPIQKWPRDFTRNRRSAPFRAGYGKTLMDLERELLHLGVTQCVIQAACGEEDIRIDGRLRSSARLQHPGIIVTFTSKKTGPLFWPCDTYSEWTDNLRAITLALTALRAVDRYGVTKHAEQYRGWKQLPDGGIPANEWASADEAARFLWLSAGWPEKDLEAVQFRRAVSDPKVLQGVFRDAAKKAHPDAGGSTQFMAKVNRAREFLEKQAGAAA